MIVFVVSAAWGLLVTGSGRVWVFGENRLSPLVVRCVGGFGLEVVVLGGDLGTWAVTATAVGNSGGIVCDVLLRFCADITLKLRTRMTTIKTTTIGGGTLTVASKDKGVNEVPNPYALAVIKSNGSVVAWGNKDYGGDISSVADQLDGKIPVTQIYSNQMAFAALREDGSVITWGDKDFGGDSSSVSYQLNGHIDVTQIFSNGNAFAALRTDGSVVTWGDKDFGGDSSKVANQLNGDTDITQIVSGLGAFAALRTDGSVVTWGDGEYYGADIDFLSHQLNGSIPIVEIYSSDAAFAVLRSDGSIVSWGKKYKLPLDNENGYTYSWSQKFMQNDARQTASEIKIFATGHGAFAAILPNGSLLGWGGMVNPRTGSAMSNITEGVGWNSIQNKLGYSISAKQIYVSGASAFAMLRDDGSVFSWGSNPIIFYDGSVIDTPIDSSVYSELNGTNPVKQIFSTTGQVYGAFAAIRKDGSVFTWGDSLHGGDSSSVASQLDGKIDIKEIYSNDGAFAALRADGSVVTWGDQIDTSTAAYKLNGVIDVIKIYPERHSFAALRADGSVVVWGGNTVDDSTIAGELNGDVNVKEIYSTEGILLASYAALREDGSVITWGDNGQGSAIADKLKSGVVAFADPSTDDFYTMPIISTKPTSGNDLVTGTANNDKLSALAGNDTITGGLGADKLTGGKGSDIFTYINIKDSGITVRTRDTITDFKHTEGDKIDLSAIDANAKLANDRAFTFIGTKAFSKTDATGQLRFDATAHVLYGSTNADNKPEFSILLSGVKALVFDDFVL